eukprot:m51a1_g184 hypothetical protein (204) ;mRNA; f:601728-602487
MQRAVSILGVLCAPKADENASALLEHAVAGAQSSAPSSVRLLSLAGKRIQAPSACADASCSTCHTEGASACKDHKDAMLEIAERLAEADIVLHGVPVYFSRVPERVRTYAERWASLGMAERMRGKVLAVVCVSGDPDAGAMCGEVVALLRGLAEQSGMQWGGSVSVFSDVKGALTKDEKALAAAYELGLECAKLCISHSSVAS